MENGLLVRKLYPPDSHQMLALMNPFLADTLYSSPMSDAALVRACFRVEPETVHDVRWFGQQVLGVLREDRLHGFIDIGIGFDEESLSSAEDHPSGLLRFLCLPPEFPFRLHVGRALLDAADAYWQDAQLDIVRAFSYSLGYPDFQGGTGVLPGTWDDHFRLLNEAGFVSVERYYCFRLPLKRPLKEPLPAASLSLVPTISGTVHRYQLLDGQELAASASFALLDELFLPKASGPVAYLRELRVAEKWRRQGIGRWLIRRVINDAIHRGCRELGMHISQRNRVALRLVAVLGFEQMDYYGHVLEKQLTAQ